MAASTPRRPRWSPRPAPTRSSQARACSRAVPIIMPPISRRSARARRESGAMPLEALIFDVDGTLAETEELHRQAFNEAFRAFGLDWVWPRDLYRELLGVTGGRERILHYIDHYAPAAGAGARAKVSEMH